MKVAVLMSGGVDSSVAVHLLQQQGHEVLGITMINWEESPAVKAEQAARVLGIPHRVVDLRARFQENVVAPFCHIYASGRTPNPCVLCNRSIKFGELLQEALRQGCEKVATGHYVRVEHDSATGRYLLRRGVDKRKDQSYFLYILSQEQLAHCVFPLGEYQKSQVKKIAGSLGLPAAQGPESQEICFIQGDYRDFLRDRVDYRPGEIVNRQGEVLGRHRGLPFYTVGQRRGLGLAAGKPIYVVDMDLTRNRLVVDEEEQLLATALLAEDNNFIMIDGLEGPRQVQAKIRYQASPAAATLFPWENGTKVVFAKPQRAITPGQAVVYYQDDYVLGGGTIVSAMKNGDTAV